MCVDLIKMQETLTYMTVFHGYDNKMKVNHILADLMKEFHFFFRITVKAISVMYVNNDIK